MDGLRPLENSSIMDDEMNSIQPFPLCDPEMERNIINDFNELINDDEWMIETAIKSDCNFSSTVPVADKEYNIIDKDKTLEFACGANQIEKENFDIEYCNNDYIKKETVLDDSNSFSSSDEFIAINDNRKIQEQRERPRPATTTLGYVCTVNNGVELNRLSGLEDDEETQLFGDSLNISSDTSKQLFDENSVLSISSTEDSELNRILSDHNYTTQKQDDGDGATILRQALLGYIASRKYDGDTNSTNVTAEDATSFVVQIIETVNKFTEKSEQVKRITETEIKKELDQDKAPTPAEKSDPKPDGNQTDDQPTTSAAAAAAAAAQAEKEKPDSTENDMDVDKDKVKEVDKEDVNMEDDIVKDKETETEESISRIMQEMMEEIEADCIRLGIPMQKVKEEPVESLESNIVENTVKAVKPLETLETIEPQKQLEALKSLEESTQAEVLGTIEKATQESALEKNEASQESAQGIKRETIEEPVEVKQEMKMSEFEAMMTTESDELLSKAVEDAEKADAEKADAEKANAEKADTEKADAQSKSIQPETEESVNIIDPPKLDKIINETVNDATLAKETTEAQKVTETVSEASHETEEKVAGEKESETFKEPVTITPQSTPKAASIHSTIPETPSSFYTNLNSQNSQNATSSLSTQNAANSANSQNAENSFDSQNAFNSQDSLKPNIGSQENLEGTNGAADLSQALNDENSNTSLALSANLSGSWSETMELISGFSPSVDDVNMETENQGVPSKAKRLMHKFRLYLKKINRECKELCFSAGTSEDSLERKLKSYITEQSVKLKALVEEEGGEPFFVEQSCQTVVSGIKMKKWNLQNKRDLLATSDSDVGSSSNDFMQQRKRKRHSKKLKKKSNRTIDSSEPSDVELSRYLKSPKDQDMDDKSDESTSSQNHDDLKDSTDPITKDESDKENKVSLKGHKNQDETTDEDKEIERLINLKALVNRPVNAAAGAAKNGELKKKPLKKKDLDILDCDITRDENSGDSIHQPEEEVITEKEYLQRCNEEIKKKLLEDSSSSSAEKSNSDNDDFDKLLDECAENSHDEDSPLVEKFLKTYSIEDSSEDDDKKARSSSPQGSKKAQDNIDLNVKELLKDDSDSERAKSVIAEEHKIDDGDDDAINLNTSNEQDKESSTNKDLSRDSSSMSSDCELLNDATIFRKRKPTKSLEKLLSEQDKRKKISKLDEELITLSSESLSSDVETVLNEAEAEASVSSSRIIKPMLRPDQLASETRKAQKLESDRVRRLDKKQERLTRALKEHSDQIGPDDLVLDYIEETKKFIKVHPGIVKNLKPHQVDGVKFMYDSCYGGVDNLKKNTGSGCILAHCMGLGKTLQLIALLHTVVSYEELKTKKVLVLCPKSTVMNWADEIKRWLQPINAKNIRCFTFGDTTDIYDKLTILKEWSESKKTGCLLMGYEAFRTLVFYHQYKSRTNVPSGRMEEIREKVDKYLLEPGADLVVCDEGHIIKNSKSAISSAVAKIVTPKRIVLTGTPIQNNLKEYYSMVNFIKPLFLGTEKEFANLYANPIKNGQHKDSSKRDIKVMKQRSFVLHKKLSKFVQRKEAELLKTFLPPKYEYVLFVPMTQTQNNLYEYILEDIEKRGDKNKGRSLITDYTCLRKIWTHPRVLADAWKNANAIQQRSKKPPKTPGVVSDDDQPDDIYDSQTGVMSVTNDWWRHLVSKEDLETIRPSNKLRTMFEILRMCEEKDEKCLIFSAFVAVLNVVEYFFDKIHKKDKETLEQLNITENSKLRGTWEKGQDYYRLDGKTSKSIRHEMIKCFNSPSNKRARVFLISAKAGGQGINLIGANRVIILDTSWNPSNDQQNIFRVFRLGQMKNCCIYRLLAMGTMEEKVYSRSVTKQAMSFRVVDEQQIDRHYNMAELAELYILTKPDYTERPIPNLPNDSILANLLLNSPDLVYKYHEHDSLLENKVEQELSEQEKADAWAAYERDLLISSDMHNTQNVENVQYNNIPARQQQFYSSIAGLNSLYNPATSPFMRSVMPTQMNYPAGYPQFYDFFSLYSKMAQQSANPGSLAGLSDAVYNSANYPLPSNSISALTAAMTNPVGSAQPNPLSALSDMNLFSMMPGMGGSSHPLGGAVPGLPQQHTTPRSSPRPPSVPTPPSSVYSGLPKIAGATSLTDFPINPYDYQHLNQQLNFYNARNASAASSSSSSSSAAATNAHSYFNAPYLGAQRNHPHTSTTATTTSAASVSGTGNASGTSSGSLNAEISAAGERERDKNKQNAQQQKYQLQQQLLQKLQQYHQQQTLPPPQKTQQQPQQQQQQKQYTEGQKKTQDKSNVPNTNPSYSAQRPPLEPPRSSTPSVPNKSLTSPRFQQVARKSTSSPLLLPPASNQDRNKLASTSNDAPSNYPQQPRCKTTIRPMHPPFKSTKRSAAQQQLRNKLSGKAANSSSPIPPQAAHQQRNNNNNNNNTTNQSNKSSSGPVPVQLLSNPSLNYYNDQYMKNNVSTTITRTPTPTTTTTVAAATAGVNSTSKNGPSISISNMGINYPSAAVSTERLKANREMEIIPTTSPPGTTSLSKQFNEISPSISLTAVRPSTLRKNIPLKTTPAGAALAAQQQQQLASKHLMADNSGNNSNITKNNNNAASSNKGNNFSNANEMMEYRPGRKGRPRVAPSSAATNSLTQQQHQQQQQQHAALSQAVATTSASATSLQYPAKPMLTIKKLKDQQQKAMTDAATSVAAKNQANTLPSNKPILITPADFSKTLQQQPISSHNKLPLVTNKHTAAGASSTSVNRAAALPTSTATVTVTTTKTTASPGNKRSLSLQAQSSAYTKLPSQNRVAASYNSANSAAGAASGGTLDLSSITKTGVSVRMVDKSKQQPSGTGTTNTITNVADAKRIAAAIAARNSNELVVTKLSPASASSSTSSPTSPMKRPAAPDPKDLNNSQNKRQKLNSR